MPDQGAAELMRFLQRTAGNQAVARLLARDKSYDSLGTGLGEADAPASIELPPELSAGLQKAWEDSFPEGKEPAERAGILVQDKAGKYTWKANSQPGDSAFSTPNYWDAKPGEKVIATGHTHPYGKKEGSITGMPESGEDLAGLITSREHLDTVQSGTKQFVVARTAELDAMLKDMDMPAKYKLADEIREFFTEKFKAAKGSPQQRNEAAVKACCAKYHFVFYGGEKGKLDLKSDPVVVKPAAGTKKAELDKALAGAAAG